MSLRLIVASVLCPLFASCLWGAGLLAAVLAAEVDLDGLWRLALTALVLSVPLSLEAAPLLVSRAERRQMDRHV